MGRYQPFNGIKETGNDWVVTINDISVPFKRIPVEQTQEILARFPEFDTSDKSKKVDPDSVGGDRMFGFQCAMIAAATNRGGNAADRKETELDLFDHGQPEDITTAFFMIMRKTVKNFDEVYKTVTTEDAADPTEQPEEEATAPVKNRTERRAQASKSGGTKPRNSASSAT